MLFELSARKAQLFGKAVRERAVVCRRAIFQFRLYLLELSCKLLDLCFREL